MIKAITVIVTSFLSNTLYYKYLEYIITMIEAITITREFSFLISFIINN